MFKISLNELTPKTDVETKKITEVETYLKKDCDNLNGVRLTKKPRKKESLKHTLAVIARYFRGEIVPHKTKGKVLLEKYRCIKFKIIS